VVARIEREEVAQLHVRAVRIPEPLTVRPVGVEGERDDLGMGLADLVGPMVEVEVKGENQFVALPGGIAIRHQVEQSGPPLPSARQRSAEGGWRGAATRRFRRHP
jgi:hypothetical protein